MAEQSAIKIIGGKFRSRKIVFPDSAGLRPTPNRIRETLFDWLQHEVVGMRCLDAFAGSGALGFEAISRGAGFVVFLEKDRSVLDAIQSNARTLAISNFNCINQNSLEWLSKINSQEAFDLIFLDPPFNQNLIPSCLELLSKNHWLTPEAWIYIESAQPLDLLELPQGLDLYRHKKAGQVHYGLVRRLTNS